MMQSNDVFIQVSSEETNGPAALFKIEIIKVALNKLLSFVSGSFVEWRRGCWVYKLRYVS